MAKPKTRSYTGVYYAENGDLQSLIEHMKRKRLPAIISPIHSADDEEKKPHAHWMVDYPSPVILETAKTDYGEVSANGYLEPVRSRSSMMRYFLHLDDQDKEQGLLAEDVITLCGATFDTTRPLDAEDIQRLLLEVQHFCVERNITDYADLLEICDAIGRLDWWRVARTNTIHMNAYLRSRRHRAERNNGGHEA